jgi:hypothetical protein
VLSFDANLHDTALDSGIMTTCSGFDASTITSLSDYPAQDHHPSMHFYKNADSRRARPVPEQAPLQTTSHKIVQEAYALVSRHQRQSAVGEDRLETLESGEQVWVMGDQHFWHDLMRHRPMRLIKCVNCVAILQVQANSEQFFCPDCSHVASLHGTKTATVEDVANAIQQAVEEAQEFLITSLEIQQEYLDTMRLQGGRV